MAYQIDQSGKIEHTNRPTVVTLANGKSFAVRIGAVEKQKLIKALQEINRPNRTYIFQIFAVLIFVLVRKLKPAGLTIDEEYPGHDTSIKEILVQLCGSHKVQLPEITFGLVGKDCQAHKVGLAVFQKKRAADLAVKAQDVLEIILGNKKAVGDPARSEGTLGSEFQ